jgi:hypothetical protein
LTLPTGFGGGAADPLRLSAPLTEALAPEQLGGEVALRQEDALADLLSSLGNRIGFERVLRLLPAQSLIPERSFLMSPAAYSVAEPMPATGGPQRPITIFPPEPVSASAGVPPASFRWRRMRFTTLRATGPERIAPEWWLDDPAWRSGLRDYWRGGGLCRALRHLELHLPHRGLASGGAGDASGRTDRLGGATGRVTVTGLVITRQRPGAASGRSSVSIRSARFSQTFLSSLAAGEGLLTKPFSKLPPGLRQNHCLYPRDCGCPGRVSRSGSRHAARSSPGPLIASTVSIRFAHTSIIRRGSAPALSSRRLEAPVGGHGWQGRRAILHGGCG